MGYIPPTFEESCNPALLERRLQAQVRRTTLVRWTSAILIAFILVTLAAR